MFSPLSESSGVVEEWVPLLSESTDAYLLHFSSFDHVFHSSNQTKHPNCRYAVCVPFKIACHVHFGINCCLSTTCRPMIVTRNGHYWNITPDLWLSQKESRFFPLPPPFSSFLPWLAPTGFMWGTFLRNLKGSRGLLRERERFWWRPFSLRLGNAARPGVSIWNVTRWSVLFFPCS